MFTMWTSVLGTKWKLTSEILMRKKKYIVQNTFYLWISMGGLNYGLNHYDIVHLCSTSLPVALACMVDHEVKLDIETSDKNLNSF